MITSIWHHLLMVWHRLFSHCKYWVSLNPGLGGVSGSMQLSTATHEQVQSNRTCSISLRLCSAFSKDLTYTFSIYYKQLHCLCSVAAVKRLSVHSVSTVIQPDLWWSLSTVLVLVCIINYQNFPCFISFGHLSILGGSNTPANIERVMFNHPKDMWSAWF